MDRNEFIDLLTEELSEDPDNNRLNRILEAADEYAENEKAQLSCEGTTFALNNQVNLCDSCTYTYPECPSEKDDVIFGNGIGNDNICACNKYQPTVQPVATDTNVGDTISRQAALEKVRTMQTYKLFVGDDMILIDKADVQTELMMLPSVQPERKNGKWLPDNNSVYEMRFICSECKESEVVPTIGFTKYKPIWDFCPNCGSYNGGERN